MEGVNAEDALRRVQSLNCLSWIVGHLANQENYFWVKFAQGRNLFPELNDLTGFRKPPSTPPWEQMRHAWETITRAADAYLDTLTPELMTTCFQWQGKPLPENIGTLLMRNIYHYWFHTGQALVVRKLLGHSNLPEFVGDMSGVAYSQIP
jgi:uncharacterized damage-inducible protein DinB